MTWISKFFGLNAVGPVTHLEWYFRHPWPGWAVLLLMAAAVFYAGFLYRKERTLSWAKRALLTGLRSLLYVIIIALLFEPMLGVAMQINIRRNVLVLFDVSESMKIVDQRKARADIEAAGKVLGKLPYDKPADNIPDDVARQIAQASRADLAKAILTNQQIDLLGRIGRQYNLQYFAFGEKLDPSKGKGQTVPEAILAAEPSAKATRLGDAIIDAVGQYPGQPIAGVIVITDGAGNAGLPPLEAAQRMKEQTVPLYPIGIGLANPPDVRLRGLVVADTVFVKDRVPVRVQVQNDGYLDQPATVTARFEGREADSKKITLGKQSQYVELYIEPSEKAEASPLEISITKMDGEVTTDNNAITRNLKVIDDKIKVLYVEGKPRWEYRYLRRVLLRDHRLEVKFLMTEGDRDLARGNDQYLAEFPTDAKAFDYDLVIIGDVASSFFTRPQMDKIDEMVRKRSGCLLMLGGLENAPASYIGTAIAGLLPVDIDAEGWHKVDDAVHPRTTEAGLRSNVVALELPDEKNDAVWGLVKPMYKLPSITAKANATNLLELSNIQGTRDPYPLMTWARVGSGKSMIIATDQLWRMRFKEGDKYHARFWGQTIQFLTLSRLLGANKRIHLEVERSSYLQGERVSITANVLNESYEPEKASTYTVQVVDATGKDPKEVPVELQEVPRMPGMFQGYYEVKAPGSFLVKANADPNLANTANFEVTESTLEQLEPAMQADLLSKMAQTTGGQFFTLSNLGDLPKCLSGEDRVATENQKKELFDLPAVFVLLLLLAGSEWLLRRKFDLI